VGRGKGGNGTKMYTHVSKCKKDNIKGEKNYILYSVNNKDKNNC
jgi:hypothetical protein